MNTPERITRTVLEYYPTVQAIYLFGSHLTENEWPESDVDLALLIPPAEAKAAGNLAMSPCAAALASLLGKHVDLLNARLVSTVFRKEITTNGRLLHCADKYAVAEFEMLAISYYQKLNEERGEIIAGGLADGRFHNL
jgi:predicted nucleotidyltransferase